MIYPSLVTRLKRAWAALTSEQQAEFDEPLNRAYEAALAFLDTRVPPTTEGFPPEMLLARIVLTDKVELLKKHAELSIRQAFFGLKPYIDKHGEIWGFGKYEQGDIYWIEALAADWENIVENKSFPFGEAAPEIVSYETDDFRLAIMGDWGTGEWGIKPSECPSQKISCQIVKARPDITIHLGDVYYAGSSGEEAANLINMWPSVPDAWGSFTLNSNHEMYPGGVHYYKALQNPLFARQKQRSFFAVETNKWIILGLDSAFNSSARLYMDGALWPAKTDPEDSPQFQLIREVAKRGKRIILLTHHNPLNYTGRIDSSTALLKKQVEEAFSGTNARPDYWYYGHIHIGAVYAPGVAGDSTQYRCVGHGGLPWGKASILEKNYPLRVSWFEQTPMPGSPNNRVANGYAVLHCKGTTIDETIYNENGALSWNSHTSVQRTA